MTVPVDKLVKSRTLVHERLAHLTVRRYGYQIALVALFLAAALLLTFRLSTWPESWFDEGLNLATAATLADEGVYGLPDSQGIRRMDPAIQTGPVVIAPVAIIFELFGVGLTQARLVMAGFAVAALCAFLLLAWRLAGPASAVVGASLLLIGSGDLFTSFVPLSRQVLGEVPALGLWCLGSWLLIREIENPTSRPIITGSIIGVVFGMAMVTKSQMALVLPLALGLFWLLNLTYYKAMHRWLPLYVLAASIGCVLLWYVAQISYLGFEQYEQSRTVLREGFSIHIARISVSGPTAALKTLWRTGFLFWGVPSLVYGLQFVRRRSKAGLVWLMPLLTIAAWLGWYVFLSIGWSRYAAVPLMLTTIFAGRLVVDLATGTANIPGVDRLRGYWSPAAAIFIVLALVIPAAGTGIRDLFQDQPQSHEEIVGYLQHEIPEDAVIETWAWELDAFVPQSLHHPPTTITNAYTREIWDGQSVPAGTYDPNQVRPDYILENSFSAWTGIYDEIVDQRGIIIAEFGEYRLYQLR